MNKYFNPAIYRDFIKRKIFGTSECYSQTGEDLILHLFLREQRKGFYVDIGANHPKIFSNTYLFYKRGWRGINIEPNPHRIEDFKKLRPRDINLNYGVGPVKAEMDFYLFSPDGLSTFSKVTADEYKKMGHRIVETLKIKVMPLKKILETHLADNKIDFLSVDTEGSELEVLKTNDWNKYRPKFLVVETLEYKKDGFGKKFNDAYDPFLAKLNYQKIADTFINTIYADKYI